MHRSNNFDLRILLAAREQTKDKHKRKVPIIRVLCCVVCVAYRVPL